MASNTDGADSLLKEERRKLTLALPEACGRVDGPCLMLDKFAEFIKLHVAGIFRADDGPSLGIEWVYLGPN